jgi:O-antigen/teichoic acid export membrane protein
VSRLGGIITFPILIRFVGADGYGAFGQITTIVGFVVPFASLGLSASLIRFFSIREWTLQTRSHFIRIAIIVAIMTSFVGSGFFAASSLLNRLFLNWRDGERLFAWGGLLLLVSAMESLLLGFFRSRQWFAQSSLLEMSQALISIGCTLILIPMGAGVVGLFQAMLLLKLVLYAAFYFGFWTWNRPSKGGWDGEPLRLRPMVSFGISGIISGLGLWMMNLGDRLVIGHFMDAQSLGHYGAVYNLAFLLMAVNAPILLPVYPRIMVSLSKSSLAATGAEARYFHRYVSLVTIPSAIFLMIAVKPAMHFLGGKGFDVDALMAAMIILAVAMDQYNAIPHYVLYSKDQMKFSQNTWIGAGILNLSLNWLLVPAMGLRGAAIATLSTFILLEWIIIARASRYIPTRSIYRFDVTAKALVAGGIAAITVSLPFHGIASTKAGLFFAALGFTIVYMVSLAVMKEINKSDFNLIRRAVFGTQLKAG